MTSPSPSSNSASRAHITCTGDISWNLPNAFFFTKMGTPNLLWTHIVWDVHQNQHTCLHETWTYMHVCTDPKSLCIYFCRQAHAYAYFLVTLCLHDTKSNYRLHSCLCVGIFMSGDAANSALTATDCDGFQHGSKHFVSCSKSTFSGAFWSERPCWGINNLLFFSLCIKVPVWLCVCFA